jgi:GTPase
MPLIDKFKDMGTVVMGKIESGSVHRGDTLMIMPNKVGFLIWGHVVINPSSSCLWNATIK